MRSRTRSSDGDDDGRREREIDIIQCGFLALWLSDDFVVEPPVVLRHLARPVLERLHREKQAAAASKPRTQRPPAA